MPIISRVGRSNPKVRLLLISFFLLLFIGAISMVYPFMIMLAGSSKSSVDQKNLSIIPAFISDDESLYRKHVEGLFNESCDAMNISYQEDNNSFEVLKPPSNGTSQIIEDWELFLKETKLPAYVNASGYLRTPISRTMPSTLRQFKNSLKKEYGEIETLNKEMETQFPGWNGFFILPDNYLERNVMPSDMKLVKKFWDYKAAMPPGTLYYFSPEGSFKRVFIKSQYSKDIEKYNAAHGTSYKSYEQLHLARKAPAGNAKETQDWENFVRFSLNPLWIRINDTALQGYRDFLHAKYGEIATLNRNYAESYKDFESIPMLRELPFKGIKLSDWTSFLMGWKDPGTGKEYKAPLASLEISSVEFMFQDYLKSKYKDISALNAKLGTSAASFAELLPPQKACHYRYFLEHKGQLRTEFLTRNFVTVIDYMLLNGRGIINTVIYCALSIIFALIVNPLAAYALSRYKLPSTYIVLLFLMLTMSFPPMVTQIPVFLTLRDLDLLNTFLALILPGMANGFSIFLLKGFFDSLPRELYESASIDGASEWTIFWQITMSLSTPVLAVIALGAFSAAYSNFMFALLICQDESMWTLMVWLYQLQQRSGEGVIHASLIIAAIPTLLVFVFCQNIIMRGIVVPTEK